jgi:phage tail sheath protein FI
VAITPTFPGVYIEEIPSGLQGVTPVATSITAFVGRAPIGPTDAVLTCFSFSDFNRFYGGLSLDYPMSYAVRDFFNNGGSQAVIARLFEPLAGQGSGAATLPFPVSPPMLPEGWMLAAATATGATALTLSAPTGGSEGEPDIGMTFSMGSASGAQYTVMAYQPVDPTKNKAATLSFFPALAGAAGQVYPICTSLYFQQGPSPAGWVVSGQGQQQLTITQGTGIPDLGDSFTVGSDTTVYTITAEPTVTMTPANLLQVVVPFSPKPTKTLAVGQPLSISPPRISPMPMGWQISSIAPGATGKPSTLALLNGTGSPRIGDQFTVGKNNIVYTVTGYTAATSKALAQLNFIVAGGGAMPTDPKAFCFCCTLNFTRPAPLDWAIGKAPKIGANLFTVSNNGGAASGVIDIGYTFLVQGDETVYTVRLYDQTSGVISFLPDAETAFAGEIVFSPPLQLVAASPGEWGNTLTAMADTNGITDATSKQFAVYDLETEDLFNLSLAWLDPRGRVLAAERYLNVAVKNTGASTRYPNRLDRVLTSQSSLCRVGVLPLAPPASGSAAIGSGGNDGDYLSPMTYIGDQNQRTGLYIFEEIPLFNLMCIPPDRRLFDDVPLALQDLDPAVRQAAATYCTDRRAIYIVDPPAIWDDEVNQGKIASIDPESLGITGENSAGIEVARNAAVYFPRYIGEDLLLKSQLATFAPCGMVAGVIAATDVSRGVWKSPAGIDAGLAGVTQLTVNLTDNQNGVLNPLGINCLRNFPVIGPVVWGARTLRGADQFEDDYKYLSVRRLTLFIEDSLYRSTQWAVFEPNDESLWSTLRLSVTSFLADLARQGAFYNYAVSCDSTTTTPTDIANGKVNILVQIAPVKPAEFVMIQIQQTAATSAS